MVFPLAMIAHCYCYCYCQPFPLPCRCCFAGDIGSSGHPLSGGFENTAWVCETSSDADCVQVRKADSSEHRRRGRYGARRGSSPSLFVNIITSSDGLFCINSNSERLPTKRRRLFLRYRTPCLLDGGAVHDSLNSPPAGSFGETSRPLAGQGAHA
jgi:hypothetical protein